MPTVALGPQRRCEHFQPVQAQLTAAAGEEWCSIHLPKSEYILQVLSYVAITETPKR